MPHLGRSYEEPSRGRTRPLAVTLAAAILVACTVVAASLPDDPTTEPSDAVESADSTETASADDVRGVVDEQALQAYCGDDWAAVEARIDGLLGELTLEEKVALMAGAFSAPLRGAWETTGNERLGVPPLRMIDGPRGVSQAAGNATAFPVAIARGATWDPTLEEEVGAAIGREARARGASVLLAPVLNLVSHPRWGRAQESYGEDPVHVGALGVGFIRGAQRYVIASAKHFAANNIESTRYNVDVTLDERTLREVFLPQFRRAVVDAHVGSVMAAYNSLNGAHCAENVPLLRDILKGDWAFQGFVESDWYFSTQTTFGAAQAGVDIEMPTARVYGNELLEAVRSGGIPESTLDEAVRRVLRATFCFGLDTRPAERSTSVIESNAHLALALQVAERSLVLLKNEGGVLPIDRSSAPSIVLVGPLVEARNIGDEGSSSVAPSDIVTALEGLTLLAGEATLTRVPDVLDEGARSRIQEADVVVVFAGLTATEEGEGQIGAGDRASMEIPADQIALIEAVSELSDAVVVVLEGGSAITVSGWVENVEGLLMAWYPGQLGGLAIAKVLFGEANPSGRLPLSMPVAESDLPPFDDVSLEVTYPRYHGYRHLDAEATAPQFPFGFGLSYTRFELANLSLSETVAGEAAVIGVSVDVTNAGGVAGIETVQLYVSVPHSHVERAVRELKGFAQVTLAPGERRAVTIELPVSALAYWDTSAQRWTVERTAYRFQVGTSSRDLPLGATLTVE